MRRVLLLLVLACLAAAQPAGASTVTLAGPGPVVSPTLVRNSERIAERLFPGSPCRGQMDIRVNADLSGTGELLDPTLKDHHAAGLAYSGTCRIDVGNDILIGKDDEPAWCTVFVHEYGHAAGFSHDAGEAARGVMAGKPRVLDWCARVMHIRADGTLPRPGAVRTGDALESALLNRELVVTRASLQEVWSRCWRGRRIGAWRCNVHWGERASQMRRVAVTYPDPWLGPHYSVLPRGAVWR